MTITYHSIAIDFLPSNHEEKIRYEQNTTQFDGSMLPFAYGVYAVCSAGATNS